MCSETLASTALTSAAVTSMVYSVRPQTTLSTMVDIVGSAAIASFVLHAAAHFCIYKRISGEDTWAQWTGRVIIQASLGLLFFLYMASVVNKAARQ